MQRIGEDQSSGHVYMPEKECIHKAIGTVIQMKVKNLYYRYVLTVDGKGMLQHACDILTLHKADNIVVQKSMAHTAKFLTTTQNVEVL